MPRTSGRFVPATLSIVLSGCATSAVDMAPDRPDRPWTPATDASGEIIPGGKSSRERAENAAYVLPANPTLGNVPAPPDVDPEHAYSLAELIDIAQSNNALTRTAWNNARNAALAAGIARSAYLPNLTASVVDGYNRFHNSNSDVSGNTTAEGTISTLSIQWLLFDFGERTAILNAAKQVSVISNIAFTADWARRQFGEADG